MAKMRKRSAIPNPSSKSLQTSKPYTDFEFGRKSGRDEEILSDSSHDEVSSEEDDIEETVDAKRIRLARGYLSQVREDDSASSDSGSEDDEDDHTTIGKKLARERLKSQGALERLIADKVQEEIQALHTKVQEKENLEDYAREWKKEGLVKYFGGHDLPVTCVALHQSGSTAYSGSKDSSVFSWDIEKECQKEKLVSRWRNTGSSSSRDRGGVLAMSASDCGRYLAVGGKDALVKIFDVRSGNSGIVQEFKGHKGSVTSLSFRSHSLDLFSGSEDRCIRHYNIDQMLYIETLYGHQAPITSLSCHLKARPISTARDRTARVWKVAEESHLIFRGGSRTTSADCCASIKDGWFFTGHEDGVINLWNTEKKKSSATVQKGHGCSVICCDALKGSDLGVSGSNDGFLRFWKFHTNTGKNEKKLSSLAKIPVHGYVNGVAIGPKGRFCVAAVGQEHRLGRWGRVPRAKNRFAIVTLKPSDNETNNEVEENMECKDNA